MLTLENKQIARTIKLLAQLMEIHEENPFKVKAITNAAFKIDKLPFQIHTKIAPEIEKIDGIGKSTAEKILKLLNGDTLSELDDLLANTPEGIVEMLGVKGIGPKKIAIIWKVLKIENIGELYYACNENRLIEAKGFGLKTQQEIIKAIEFKMASGGKQLYVNAETLVKNLLKSLDKTIKIAVSGAFRRKLEIIDQLDFVVEADQTDLVFNLLANDELATDIDKEKHIFKYGGLPVTIFPAAADEFATTLFATTGCDEHVQQVLQRLDKQGGFDSEEAIYKQAGLAFIEPELRENLQEIELAAQNKLSKLINFEDLKGTLHNHSTWSDGVHTIEEMALFCRDQLKLAYLGMCDHSKSAVYAKGLSIERLLNQFEEIDHLNKKLAPFKIFKGIESDILGDGSLDYPEEILKKFDFVVASVHSNLKMSEEKATERLIKAIENPYTTILGHPTGRLLLSRSGYPIDFKKIIDACAANQVVIEINANPLRLDLDWRWHQYALNNGVLLSVNPDAHRNEGFMDMQYGIYIARKGGLTANKCLNAFTLDEISAYFEKAKNKF